MKNQLGLLTPPHLIEKSGGRNAPDISDDGDGNSAQNNEALFPPRTANDQRHCRRQSKKHQQHAQSAAGFSHAQGSVSEHDNVPLRESRASQRLQHISASLSREPLQRLPEARL